MVPNSGGRLRQQGYHGSLRVVSEWATRRRRSERMETSQLHKVPSARTVTRLMTMKRNHLTKAEAITVAAVETGVPTLAEARSLLDRFQAMIRCRAVADLDTWIADAEVSLLASFARGLGREKAAVRAAIAEPWSNGQSEGQVNKYEIQACAMGEGPIHDGTSVATCGRPSGTDIFSWSGIF